MSSQIHQPKNIIPLSEDEKDSTSILDKDGNEIEVKHWDEWVKKYKPTTVYEYTSTSGTVLLRIMRKDYHDKHGKLTKKCLPFTRLLRSADHFYNKLMLLDIWSMDKNPLYNLFDLEIKKSIYPGEKFDVLIVEGEKCAEVARQKVGDKVWVTTWMMGTSSVDKADWKVFLPYANKIFFWPDKDSVGLTAVDKVLDILDLPIHIVKTEDFTAAYDIADFCEDYPQTAVWPYIIENSYLRQKLKLEKNSQGKYYATSKNIKEIFLKHPAWQTKIVFNELAGSICLKKGALSNTQDKYLSTTDVVLIKEWLDETYEFSACLNKQEIEDCLTMIAHKNKFHPLRDRLNLLTWDGVDRFQIDWLHVKEGTKHLCYKMLRMWMQGAIRRAFEPGCEMRELIVLQGEEHIGKTDFLRTLGYGNRGEGGFYGALTSGAHSKEIINEMLGLWIIELEEMEALLKSTDAASKGFISRQEDIYRIPYEKRASAFKRHCVMAATTNEEEYLNDASSNTRYLPLDLLGINLSWVKKNVDQLWAQIIHAYRTHTFLVWTKEELQGLAELRECKRIQDVWLSPIQKYLEARTSIIGIHEILSGVFNISPSMHSKSDQMRVSKILKVLGWVQANRLRINGGRIRPWERKAPLSSNFRSYDGTEDELS